MPHAFPSCTLLTHARRYDIQPERSADVDPKKVVRHVYVGKSEVTAAKHGESSSVGRFMCCIPWMCHPRVWLGFRAQNADVSAGPVAFVLATLHDDFNKKFKAWVDSL